MFRTFRRALTLLAALLLLASAFSDVVSPEVLIVAAYLGLLFPFILLADVVWLLLLVAMRRWRLVLVMVLVMAACSTRIWRYMPLHFVKPEPVMNVITQAGIEKTTEVDTFQVMTFNTRALGDAHLGKVTDPLPVMDLVRDCGADVVCLQEYTYSLKGGHTEKQLCEMVKKQYPHYRHLLNSGRNNMGITLFSKWPIVKYEKIDTNSDKYVWAFYCELDVDGRRVCVVNCHLQSNTLPKADRKLYKQQIEHFEADSLVRMEDGLRHLIPAFRLRAKQTGIINRFLADKFSNQNIPLLICGDMNDTPTSYTYRTMRGSLSDAWQDAGLGLGITYREAPFWFRIDHVLHSEHFHTLDAQVLRHFEHSDHYPVMVTFQLLPEEE